MDNTAEQTIYNESTGVTLIPADTFTYTYDALGRITRAENRSAVTVRAYTKEGLLQKDSQWVKVASTANVLRYTYHPSGARDTMYAGGRAFKYTYLPGNLLSRITWGSEFAAFDYDELGRRDSLYYSAAAATAYRYDKDGRPWRVLTTRLDGTPLVDVEYEQYDANGRPLSMIDRSARYSGNFLRQRFAYDGRDQLIRHGFEGVTNRNLRHVYDAVGNRTWELSCTPTYSSCSDSTQFVYYLNSSGQTTQRIGRRISWLSGQSPYEQHDYYYDENGNQVRDGWWESAGFSAVLKRFYNAADQLQATRPTSMPANVFFLYDALGRRQRGTAGDSTSLFFYDLENVVRYGSGAYLHGPGTDDPLVAFMPSGNLCPNASTTQGYYTTFVTRLRDFYGNAGPSCFADASGQVYAPWEGWGSHAGAILDSEGFGLQRSSGTRDGADLSFFRSRFYDARTGQFLQEDPIQFVGGVNLYAYSGNNPATYTDPFGLAPCPPDNDCGALTVALGTTGAFVGGFGGGIFGGGLGLACGPAAPACSSAGATAFSAQGAALGSALGAGLGVFFSRQSDAVRKAEGLKPRVQEHIDKLRNDPTGNAARHWQTELRGWLDQISRAAEKMGRRSGEQWREFVQQATDQINRITGGN